MSGHRRYRRRRSSSSGSRSTSRSSRRASTTERDDNDVHSHRRLKRSSASLPVRRSPSSHHSWVLLSRAGAWLQDGLAGDSPTSAMSRTSKGEEISVSFELVEPPGTSVLTVASSSTTTPRKSIRGNAIAAHRDVVLLAVTTTSEKSSLPYYDSVIDLFVYQASRDDPSRRRRRPSPLLMPLPSAVGHEVYYHRLVDGEIGIMSCGTSNDVVDDDGSPPSFLVAELRIWRASSITVRLFRSGTGQWETFENLHIHGANGGRDLHWWSTDAVVPYGCRRYMIWVDYYRGIVIMDLSSQSASETTTTTMNSRPPRLQYVPLPVNKVDNPENIEFGGRGCPKESRRVCVTRHGVKFVSIDSQYWSNFGIGNHHVLEWSQRFRITTWWLREDDDNTWRWRKDLTMHQEEFWEAINGGDRFPFPHVEPRFPVVDLDNPDVVVFRIEKPGSEPDEPKWMIEVDLRKKVLLAATAYSKESGDDDAIPSELPRYLDDGQACKKRLRQ